MIQEQRHFLSRVYMSAPGSLSSSPGPVAAVGKGEAGLAVTSSSAVAPYAPKGLDVEHVHMMI